MKITKRSHSKTIRSVLSKLWHIVIVIDEHRNSYFWSPPSSAYQRRSSEFSESYEFEILGDKIEVGLARTNSCKHVYFSKTIYVNDKKTNVTKLKGIIKKLESILESRDKKKSAAQKEAA